jgi:molybdopterin/thiamine biosynthesis adenylyltransferase
MIDNRYSKQILFNNIGPEGQKRISASTVIVVGIVALGHCDKQPDLQGRSRADYTG